MICKKCGHDAEPISKIVNLPESSITPHEKDLDYKKHEYGLTVDDPIFMGLHVCRNCYSIQEYWIEDATGAEFKEDWGKPRLAAQPTGLRGDHG